MLRHEEKCENSKCKENGWDKLKVIEVEYIGLTEEEVNILQGDPDKLKVVDVEYIEDTVKYNILTETTSLMPQSRNENPDNDDTVADLVDDSCCCNVS